jgi:gamma-glutamylputrescine oxidase
MSNYIDSYYSRTIAEPGERPALEQTIEVETCVVGGGLAGLATALELAERGRSVALIEAHRVGWGASGRNGGFMNVGYPQGMAGLVKKVGLAQAQEMFSLSREGHTRVLDRISAYQIDCGPVEAGALRCNMADGGDNLPEFIDYMSKNFGLELEYWSKARLGEALATRRYADGFFSSLTRRFHPLNLARGLARAIEQRGGKIFEQSPATALGHSTGHRFLRTPAGEVRCEHIVLACGGYIGTKLALPVAMATVPVATFVMVTEPLGDKLRRAISVPYAISDIQMPTNYYRPLHDGRLLWGGRVLTWEPGAERLATRLRRDMTSFYPSLKDARVEVAWGGYMGYLRHRTPFIGRVDEGLWVAAGFGGLGLALTTMAGELLARAIADHDDRWRLFTRFGLPFAGGPLGRLPAQLVYWRDGAKRYLRK